MCFVVFRLLTSPAGEDRTTPRRPDDTREADLCPGSVAATLENVRLSFDATHARNRWKGFVTNSTRGIRGSIVTNATQGSIVTDLLG